MNLNTRHKRHGHTIAEHIETVPNELPVDAVSMGQIVPAGRDDFGLSGENLTEFVSRCVLALLEAGAKPVQGGRGTEYDWIVQPHYGETNEEIVKAVVKEWLTKDEDDIIYLWSLWFALPSPYVGRED